MFLDWDLPPLSNHAPQCSFQLVKRSVSFPLAVPEPGMVQLKETQAELKYLWFGTHKEQNGLKAPSHVSSS